MKNKFAEIKTMQLDTDYLTGLLNRRGLNEIWNSLPSTFELHCVYLDIDNFKLVNDVYGHSKGDELLIFVAGMLKRIFADQLVVRMGGDEFCILCNGEIAKDIIEAKFPKLQEELAEEDFEGSIDNVLSFSIGVLYNQKVAAGLNTILLKCDDAMYYMKKHGKNGVVNYDAISCMLEERKAIKSRAKYALENDEISILLNPIMFLQTSEVYAAEAVLEWKFPSLGILSEDRFLPVFEQYGIIRQMNAITFEKVCEWKDGWKGTAFESLYIYVKLSASFILQKSGLDFIRDCLDRYHINPNEIAIGIEESQFLDSRAKMMDTVDKLKELGIRIAINNFGSASSIKVLQDSASKILKLDRKLIEAAEESEEGQLILRNVVSLGRDLYCTIIAQGIDTSSRISMLVDYGAQVGVGDFYGAPLREIDFKYKYKSMLLSERNIKPVAYAFENNLKDNADEYIGSVVGREPEYTAGVSDKTGAVHFPGGRIRENVVRLPKEVMYSDSYSICFWLNTDREQPWTSLIYVAYLDGFMSLVPINGEAGFTFRIKDDREPNVWHDLNCRHAVPGQWAYVCATYDAMSGIARLYFNGLPVQTLEHVPCLKVVKEVIVGGDDYQVSYEGKLAALEFYHYAMTAENILRKFNAYKEMPSYMGPKGKK